MSEDTAMVTGANLESAFLEDPDGLQGDDGVEVVIARETRRIMGEWLAIPHQDPAIDAEARRLQRLTETAAAQHEDAFRRQWRLANPGLPPAFPDTTAMRQTAWDQARAEILEAELYPRVTPELVAEIEETDAMIAAMVRAEIAATPADRLPF